MPTHEPEHHCDTGHFDRTICPEPCGTMHSFCSTCGKRQDACAHEPEGVGRGLSEVHEVANRWRSRTIRAEAEVARLRAQVAAVSALASRWNLTNATTSCPGCSSCTQRRIAADALNAALSDPGPVLAQVKAEAWDEGHDAGPESHALFCECPNPYRGGA